MATFVKGDVVVVPFPFSDLSSSKRRPALVLTSLEGDDLILSQITSQNMSDSYSISIGTDDIENGSLSRDSNVRPNKIFTADKNIILYKVGNLDGKRMEEVTNKVIEIFTK